MRAPGRCAGALPALAALALGACADDPVAPEEPLALTTIVAGGAHTCALDDRGRAWCWGSNSHGQLGISDDRATAPAPLAVNGSTRFRALSAGTRHTCGVATDDRVWCWGENASGQLGDGTHTPRAEPRPVPLELRFAHVSAGDRHTCGVATDGRAWCWGGNASGQLGVPAVDGGGSPLPVPAAEDLRFSSIAAGWEHTCGVTIQASAACWGANRAGELGGATVEGSVLPVRVAGSHVYRRLRAGASFTCGATARDEVACWGTNAGGELGLQGAAAAGTPVTSLEVRGLVGVASAPAGSYACAAGVAAVTCWGSATLEGVRYRLVPHAPAALPSGAPTSLAAGAHHGCAVVDGEAWCWGAGGSGQLGDGRAERSSDAVRVLTGSAP